MKNQKTNRTAVNLRQNIPRALILFFLIIASVFTLFPIYISLLNSFKSKGDLLNNMLSFPSRIEFANYINAFKKTGYLNCLYNNFTVVAVGLTGIVLFSSMAGYKICRTKTKWSSFIFGLFVSSMLIPFYSIMISLYKIVMKLGLDDSLPGLGTIYIGLGVSMAIFLYHGFVKSISQELEESARIDGCGEFRTFFRIVFPLLSPITFTIIILNALWMWNDFLLPLLVLSDFEKYTILISITILFGEYGNNEWTEILATLIMAMLPAIIFYFLLQKYIVKGIAEGAIKG